MNNAIPFAPHVNVDRKTEGDQFAKECYEDFHKLMQLRKQHHDAIARRERAERELSFAKLEEQQTQGRFREAKLSLGQKVSERSET